MKGLIERVLISAWVLIGALFFGIGLASIIDFVGGLLC